MTANYCECLHVEVQVVTLAELTNITFLSMCLCSKLKHPISPSDTRSHDSYGREELLDCKRQRLEEDGGN